MSHHHAVRALEGTLLWRDHAEARVLWDALWVQVPDPMALCLMPDHVHLLHGRDVRQALGRALRAYARWRNRQRGTTGQVWRRREQPEAVRGAVKERRSVRYIHLNPCRAGLVADPLAWPWSTHRDRVGLAAPGRVRLAPDAHDFHAYVSADPTVSVSGTALPLPIDRVGAGSVGLDRLRCAVSAVTRTPLVHLDRRGAARTLLHRSMRCLSPVPHALQASLLGLHPRSLRKVSDGWTDELRVVARAAGDPRFGSLVDGDLRHHRSWGRYRWLE